MVDPLVDTQPSRPRDTLSDYQPIRVTPYSAPEPAGKKNRLRPGCGCWSISLILLVLGLITIYVGLPPRTNIVLMGIDDRAPGEALGRSDTLILMTFVPVRRYVGMLSIPRDLWVQVPGYGEDRINTAHFYAEAEQPGSGPTAVKAVIRSNFGVEARYFIRVRFDNFLGLVDAVGGVDITLEEPMSGYAAGTHHLDAEQALAFVRSRAGADDFTRLRKAQILIRSFMVKALSPGGLLHWPTLAQVGLTAVETDLPAYLWPKFGLAFLLAGPEGLEARIIEREMVAPFTTEQGAQVLAPRWDLILPLVQDMFGE
jgi:LCP family protein required for cell wall assembly